MSHTVVFPGLGLSFDLNPIPFAIFGWPIHWYGIIIATGFLLAVGYCLRVRHRSASGRMTFWTCSSSPPPSAFWRAALLHHLLFGLLPQGRRLSGLCQDGPDWDGGLAIYGGVIAAALTLLVFCRVRHIPFLAFADSACLVFSLGRR